MNLASLPLPLPLAIAYQITSYKRLDKRKVASSINRPITIYNTHNSESNCYQFSKSCTIHSQPIDVWFSSLCCLKMDLNIINSQPLMYKFLAVPVCLKITVSCFLPTSIWYKMRNIMCGTNLDNMYQYRNKTMAIKICMEKSSAQKLFCRYFNT